MSGRPDPEPLVTLSAVDRAMATGYSYGRLDARCQPDGPLIHTREFLAAVAEGGVDVGGFPALYAQLQADAARRGAAS